MTPLSDPTTPESPANKAQAPLQIHRLPLEVHIFDTDCYGVMWHGAYIKWLEMGRVGLLKQLGITLSKPTDPDGLVYPVVEQQLRFRSPARLHDQLILTTSVMMQSYKLLFNQKIAQANDHTQTVLEAMTTCVVLDSQWKPLRRLPAIIVEALQ